MEWDYVSLITSAATLFGPPTELDTVAAGECRHHSELDRVRQRRTGLQHGTVQVRTQIRGTSSGGSGSSGGLALSDRS